uniref:Uncharacterized protein n=1 Tax=Rousettus aegyptiacus TaxID=9407 RepID=A0A7J8DXR9_ROUAE|nr:hypothetical protein HJG63_008349 [Rousettus aegyptiacus]
MAELHLHTGTGEGSAQEHWIPRVLLYRASLTSLSALTPTTQCPSISPYCPLRSLTSTVAESQQVHHLECLLADMAPLKSGCRCHCHSLCCTQPRILTPTYLLQLQGDFLDFSLDVWLVHLAPRRFSLLFTPRFHHNFDLVTRGMNRASTICVIFFSLMTLHFCFVFKEFPHFLITRVH